MVFSNLLLALEGKPWGLPSWDFGEGENRHSWKLDEITAIWCNQQWDEKVDSNSNNSDNKTIHREGDLHAKCSLKPETMEKMVDRPSSHHAFFLLQATSPSSRKWESCISAPQQWYEGVENNKLVMPTWLQSSTPQGYCWKLKTPGLWGTYYCLGLHPCVRAEVIPQCSSVPALPHQSTEVHWDELGLFSFQRDLVSTMWYKCTQIPSWCRVRRQTGGVLWARFTLLTMGDLLYTMYSHSMF